MSKPQPFSFSFFFFFLNRCHRKNNSLKMASIGQAIVQVGRPRIVIAPLQIVLAVQLHQNFASHFLIDTLHHHGFCSSYHEVQTFKQNAALDQGTDIPSYMVCPVCSGLCGPQYQDSRPFTAWEWLQSSLLAPSTVVLSREVLSLQTKS